MSVDISVRLTNAEVVALIRAERGGWQTRPSKALQSADAKIRQAIADAEGEA